MFVMAKNLKSCLPLLGMEQLLVLDVCLLRQSFQTLDCPVCCGTSKKRRNRKIVTLLPKQNTNSLRYAHGSKSVIFFKDLCKPIKIYVYSRKKHPFASFPAAKHLSHSKFDITDMREKPAGLFYCTTRALTLAPAICLLTQVRLQKFPFLQNLQFLVFTLYDLRVVFSL